MQQAIAASPGRTESEHAPAQGGLVMATLTLWQREMVRFFRERTRVTSTLITPLLLWAFVGAGFSRFHISVPGMKVSVVSYMFPGMITMIILFTAIFSTITVIEDRREGFLQGVLVAPVSRLAIVLGKVLGGTMLAMIQGIIVLAIWPWVGHYFSVGSILAAIGVMFVLSVALTALGLCIAWPMDSTAGFHAIMMLVLFPMWGLCGAFFPLATAPMWLKVLMYADPLTYGQSVLDGVMEHGTITDKLLVPGDVALPLMCVFTLLVVGMAGYLASKPRKDGT